MTAGPAPPPPIPVRTARHPQHNPAAAKPAPGANGGGLQANHPPDMAHTPYRQSRPHPPAAPAAPAAAPITPAPARKPSRKRKTP